jgi:SAM-dependent methyltransferase
MTDAKNYDEFAEQWFERRKQKQNHAHLFLEKPAMYGKLPDLAGKRVLCLGCGTGEECADILQRLPAEVVGVDLSEGMLEVARREVPGVVFQSMDMNDLRFPGGRFDFVYSSLVMHYARDWTKPLSEVCRVLAPGGRFLFSTHHPLKWGAQVTRSEGADTFVMGYSKPKMAGIVPQVFGDYFTTRRIEDRWFDAFDVSYYHKPLSEILAEIRNAGLQILDFVEPKATPEALTVNPIFHAIHQKIPLFMIFELGKP